MAVRNSSFNVLCQMLWALHDKEFCALECLPKFIGKNYGAQPNPHAYCKLGCAMNTCIHINTKKNIGTSFSLKPCS